MKLDLKGLSFLALLFVVAPALAEDASVRTLCQMLPAYRGGAGVNYTPGADVYGRMVAPADINQNFKNGLDLIEFPVTYDVLQNLNITPPAGIEAKPLVAVIRVYQDGRVTYNSQDITGQAQGLCAGGRSVQSRTAID